MRKLQRAVRDGNFEPFGINAYPIKAQDVAGRASLKAVAQDFPKLGDMALQRGRRGGRCLVAPNVLKQGVRRDGATSVEEKAGNQGPAAGTAQWNRPAAFAGLSWSQDLELDWVIAHFDPGAGALEEDYGAAESLGVAVRD